MKMKVVGVREEDNRDILSTEVVWYNKKDIL